MRSSLCVLFVLWAAGILVSSFIGAVAKATNARTDRNGRILVGPDLTSPAVNFAVRGSGQKGWFGWADDAKIEELRDAWFAATDAAGSKKAADAVQARAFEFVPYVPTAQFILPTAYRTNLTGVIIAPINLLWNVEKK